MPERSDRGVHPGTALLLLEHERALLFGVVTIGDVLVGADPVVATDNRPVDDGNRPPIRRLDDAVQGIAAGYRGEDVGRYFSMSIAKPPVSHRLRMTSRYVAPGFTTSCDRP